MWYYKCDKGRNPTQCESCKDENSTLCATCNMGDYLKDGKCLNCEDKILGCSKCSIENTCEACNPQFLLENNKCIPAFKKIPECFNLNKNDSSICNQCVSGFYLTKDNKTCLKCSANCLDCNNATSCVICKSTFYVKNGKCEACPQYCSSCEKISAKAVSLVMWFIITNASNAKPIFARNVIMVSLRNVTPV